MNKIDGINLIMKNTDKITLTVGQLKKLVKESFGDKLSVKDFHVGDKVEYKYRLYKFAKERWYKGVITKVSPRWGITIEFPEDPILPTIAIPPRYLYSDFIRIIESDPIHESDDKEVIHYNDILDELDGLDKYKLTQIANDDDRLEAITDRILDKFQWAENGDYCQESVFDMIRFLLQGKSIDFLRSKYGNKEI